MALRCWPGRLDFAVTLVWETWAHELRELGAWPGERKRRKGVNALSQGLGQGEELAPSPLLLPEVP